jgi:hypothetical protein
LRFVEYRLHSLRLMFTVNFRGYFIAAVLFAPPLLASSATAQQRNPLTRMGGLVISVFAGGAAYTDLQRSAARVELTSTSVQPQTAEFTRRLSPETSPALAVAAGYWFTPHWGIRAHVGLAPSRFDVMVSEREAALLPQDSLLLGPSYFAPVTIWTGDVQMLVRAPFTPRGRVAPYGILGGGVIRYVAGNSAPLPPEAEPAFAADRSRTKASIVLGAGAMVPLQRHSLALSFELTDHLARTPVERTPSRMLSEGSAIRVVTSELNEQSVEGRVRTTSHVRLLVGLTWLVR